LRGWGCGCTLLMCLLDCAFRAETKLERGDLPGRKDSGVAWNRQAAQTVYYAEIPDR